MSISRKIQEIVLVGLLVMPSGSALAEDIALVIGNGVYEHQRNIRGVRSGVSDLIPIYEDHGYTVIEGYDLNNIEFRDVLTRFAEMQADADRVIVHYTGYTLHAGRTTWLAPIDLVRGSIVDTAYGAPALDVVFEMLAQKPGRAAIFIGTFDDGNRTVGSLEPGLGPIDAPQGVFVLSGRPTDVVNAIEKSILVEGSNVATAVSGMSSKLTASGFRSPDMGFGRMPAPLIADGFEDDDISDIDRERQLWARVQADTTIAALETYLREYPDGAFAGIAKRRLEKLSEPLIDPSEAAEQALKLTRTARRNIQEDLVILGYDTRGVDGIFGPGTRKAAGRWQADQGLLPSGFVSRVQIRLLESQAAKRAQEIAAEAERQREEEERADLAFWRSTGATGTAEGLREYLASYPDGVYSQEAADALAEIEAEDRAAAEAADTAAWDRALATDSIEGYRNYLNRYPDGAFVETAKARIRRINGEPDDSEIAAYKRTEDRLGLSAQTRALIERRLRGLDFDPGRIDGRFDEDARKAIRRFQRAQGLDVTGYINGDTVRGLIVASR